MDFTLFQHGSPLLQIGTLNLDLLNDVASGGLLLAQVFKDDLFSNVGRSWDNFIRSGQVWALVIGFFVGYLFRSLTA
jgi:hypothetical protein